MSYRCFAQFYDILTQNIPYRARGEYFHALFQRYGLPGNIVLDLACGTGSLTEALASLGYDMIGVDGSEEMLAEAMNKKYDAQSNTRQLKSYHRLWRAFPRGCQSEPVSGARRRFPF